MESLNFGLSTTGSDIHFTWSNGVITLSDKFTGDIRLADGGCIRVEDGKFVYRIIHDPVEYMRAEPGSPVWESQRGKSHKLVDSVKEMESHILLRLSHSVCPSCGVDEGDVCDPDCDYRKVREYAYLSAKELADEYARLPHPCVQDVVAGEDIPEGEFVQMKGEGPLRAAYRCFSIAQDMRKAQHEYFLTCHLRESDNQLSCKCVSLLNGHEPNCPMENNGGVCGECDGTGMIVGKGDWAEECLWCNGENK
jgi:hypothetical protein